MTSSAAVRARLGRVIGAVVRQAVQDAGADGVVLAAADTPDGRLAREWCAAALGPNAVVTATTTGRFLTAHPASKTALLLAERPVALLFPIGDLYASQVEALTGGWTAPGPVLELAADAGGVAALDGALQRWAEGRRPIAEALAGLPRPTSAAVEDLIRAHRFDRWHCGLVPKLTSRTLGIDLWE